MKEDPSLMEGDERRFKLQCPYVMFIGTACFHAPRFLEGWRSRHTDHPTRKATVVTVCVSMEDVRPVLASENTRKYLSGCEG